MGKCLGRTLVVTCAASLLVLLGWSGASAQTASPSPGQDCSDFATQEEAQRAFDAQNGSRGPLRGLDVDGDGRACEGLPTSGGAPSPTTSPVASPTASPGQTLPRNGAGTVAIALSGLTFLEAGYGLTLLAKRLGVRRRRLPVYLLQKLVKAAREGRNEVQLGDDVYLVRIPAGSPRALPPAAGPVEQASAVAPPVEAIEEPVDVAPPQRELFLGAEDAVLWIEQPITDSSDERADWPFFTPPS